MKTFGILVFDDVEELGFVDRRERENERRVESPQGTASARGIGRGKGTAGDCRGKP
jgi:hypothetical protein